MTQLSPKRFLSFSKYNSHISREGKIAKGHYSFYTLKEHSNTSSNHASTLWPRLQDVNSVKLILLKPISILTGGFISFVKHN